MGNVRKTNEISIIRSIFNNHNGVIFLCYIILSMNLYIGW
jgi:hypothetical protein